MITVDDLVQAARLSPSVGPFTVRRILFRSGIFSDAGYAPEQLRPALPDLLQELRESHGPADFARAGASLEELLAASATR